MFVETNFDEINQSLYNFPNCFNSRNPIQDGVGAKMPPTSFSPVTSTNVRICPQNFLTFGYNPFAIFM